MAASPHSAARSSRYDDYDDEDDFGDDFGPVALHPGDRIGPVQSAKGGLPWRTSLVILTAIGGGWAMLDEPPDLKKLQSTVMTAVAPLLERASPKSTPTPAPAVASAETPPAPPGSAAADEAATAEKTQIATASPSAYPPAPAAQPAPAPKVIADAPLPAELPPAPPVIADKSDPLRKRAEAVGLHPELSRVLLERLTKTDYRNAGTAIEKAFAQPTDAEVLVWPAQRKPEQALYHVRFVPGAAPSCRRYVVTVTKDGWLTTALPMEKCGAKLARPAQE